MQSVYCWATTLKAPGRNSTQQRITASHIFFMTLSLGQLRFSSVSLCSQCLIEKDVIMLSEQKLHLSVAAAQTVHAYANKHGGDGEGVGLNYRPRSRCVWCWCWCWAVDFKGPNSHDCVLTSGSTHHKMSKIMTIWRLLDPTWQDS